MPVTDATSVTTRWLFAQSTAFGVMAAWLAIGANALFLDEYGSKWLPVTYLFIGLAGIIVSGAVAAAARSGDLVRIATAVLGGAAVLIAAAGWIAVSAGAVWVSAPLLVLFPVLLQLGFVFVGAQAGRLLDLAGIKRMFPVIIAGFPIGAVLGGVVAPAILSIGDDAGNLIVAAGLAEALFAALLVATNRRVAPTTASPAVDRVFAVPPPRPSMRGLLTQPFVVLLLGYQVWSAIASQLADFLVFDRAAARYGDGAELARFVAWYTAGMNVVSIVFLALVAGPLLRRHGLRLGIAANPAVLAVCGVAMITATVGFGAGSAALLAVVSIARVADIALTDGTTRTSINTVYQVLPADERLAVQTSVEGVGVPVAIALSGALILVLDALPWAVTSLVVATAVVCALWTWNGLRLYRAYVTSLVDAVQRPILLDDLAVAGAGEERAARGLLELGDAPTLGVGFELAVALGTPAIAADLSRLHASTSDVVRIGALAASVRLGDDTAQPALAAEVERAVHAGNAEVRLAAARALPLLTAPERVATPTLFSDPDVRVRRAALEAVAAGDTRAIDSVCRALADTSTRREAIAAARRLGDHMAPVLMDALQQSSNTPPDAAARLLRATRLHANGLREDLARHIDNEDREIGMHVILSLVADAPAAPSIATFVETAIDEDLRHAGRIASALADLDPDDPRLVVVRRALSDELTLIRARVAAACRVVVGDARARAVVVALGDPTARHDLAAEALLVTLQRPNAEVAATLLNPTSSSRRLAAELPRPAEALPASTPLWLADMIADPHCQWRSEWLRASAVWTAKAHFPELRADVDTSGAAVHPWVAEQLAAAG